MLGLGLGHGAGELEGCAVQPELTAAKHSTAQHSTQHGTAQHGTQTVMGCLSLSQQVFLSFLAQSLSLTESESD